MLGCRRLRGGAARPDGEAARHHSRADAGSRGRGRRPARAQAWSRGPGGARAHRRRAERRRRSRRRRRRSSARRSPRFSTRSSPRRSPRCVRPPAACSGTTVVVTGHEMTWDMVHYDVQLMGGIQLHLGKIAEMATGEGKTLVATLPLYLNALPGKGAHLVTVNSYLARRDSQWMGHLYSYLGLTVACLDDTEPGRPSVAPRTRADITYGTNNEFGFDYLRDNMVVVARAARAARARLRDRRRSGLGADRRGAHAADHLGPGRQRERRDVLRAQRRRRATRAPSDGARQRARRRSASAICRDGQTRRGAGIKLYQAQLGSPKNKRLLKLMQEPGVKQLVQKTELDHIADRKLPRDKQQYRDIEEDSALRARREGPLGAPHRSRRRRSCRRTITRRSCCPTSRWRSAASSTTTT